MLFYFLWFDYEELNPPAILAMLRGLQLDTDPVVRGDLVELLILRPVVSCSLPYATERLHRELLDRLTPAEMEMCRALVEDSNHVAPSTETSNNISSQKRSGDVKTNSVKNNDNGSGLSGPVL